MAQQSIAQEWLSFSPERRRGLLARMSPVQKKNLRRAIESAQTDSTTAQAAVPDFTSNPSGEGVYRMMPASDAGLTRSEDEIQVPFGRVKDAEAAGYHLHPDEALRYQKDFAHQGKGPTLLERADRRIQQALAPVPHEQFGASPLTNVDRSVGRTFYALPGFLKDLALAYSKAAGPGGGPNDVNNLIGMIDPGQVPVELQRQFQEDMKVDPKMAIDNLTGSLIGVGLVGAATHGAGEVAQLPGKGVGALRRAAETRFAPRTVELAGEKIPVAVGEAAPESAAGRLQTRLKRSGTGARKFTALENAQQEAVKAIIRRTAQQTSELIGPMQEEPGPAIEDAANATFAAARPMYAALDASLKNVPGTFQHVSQIVRDAITRARKLGANVGEEPADLSQIVPDANGTIQWGGTRISKATHPERWAQLVRDGIINDGGEVTPLTAYMRVRSQLLRMQRSASDPALRNAIGNEVRIMNDTMQAALQGTPLAENWAEASRLWAKGYALRDVAEAIADATKGTPAANQAPGLSPVPTRLQGASLVDQLNTLANDGILDRAFSPDEVKNLRQAADILDRIQRTPVGKGNGESMSRSRGLAHAISGAAGPVAGGAVGFVLGHGLRGAEAGAGIGFLVQAIGERALVGVMTQIDGVNALKAIESAKTPIEAQRAMKALAAVAAAQQSSRSPKKLREEGQKRKAVAPGPQSANRPYTHVYDELRGMIVPA